MLSIKIIFLNDNPRKKETKSIIGVFHYYIGLYLK